MLVSVFGVPKPGSHTAGRDVAVIRIREAVLGDAAAIASVHTTSWRETYTGLVPPEMIARNTEARRLVLWREILAAGERDVFVAEDAGGAVTGFICGGAMPESIRARPPIHGYDGYIYTLYVVRAAHRRGIGRALLAALAERFRARGFGSMALHVVEQNPARAFYERLGGRRLHSEPYTPGIDEATQVAYGWDDITNVPTGTRSVDGSTAGR